jgi:hypothetical protein
MQSYTSQDTSNSENWEIGWQQCASQDKSLTPKLRLTQELIGSQETLNTTAMREKEVDLHRVLSIQKLLLQKPPELWATNPGGQTE